jgi:hypothetical protein
MPPRRSMARAIARGAGAGAFDGRAALTGMSRPPGAGALFPRRPRRDVVPCPMRFSQSPDGASSSGLWIDGHGDQWKLSDVQMPGALQEIKEEYNVCIATTIACPI